MCHATAAIAMAVSIYLLIARQIFEELTTAICLDLNAKADSSGQLFKGAHLLPIT